MAVKFQRCIMSWNTFNIIWIAIFPSAVQIYVTHFISDQIYIMITLDEWGVCGESNISLLHVIRPDAFY